MKNSAFFPTRRGDSSSTSGTRKPLNLTPSSRNRSSAIIVAIGAADCDFSFERFARFKAGRRGERESGRPCVYGARLVCRPFPVAPTFHQFQSAKHRGEARIEKPLFALNR